MNPTAPTPALPDLPVVAGIGCRLPGGVRGPEQFSELLRSGCAVTAPVPKDRWKAMAADLAPGARPARRWSAGLLDEPERAAFDAAYFGIEEAAAAAMDPLHRLLLETAVEALADAGIPASALAGPRTGIYTGTAAIDAAVREFAPGRSPGLLEVGGACTGMIGTRLARHLDARGPLLSIDTACSASLTALHYACRDLQDQRVDTALVAGLNSVDNAVVTSAFAAGGVLARVCRPFDARAAGYVRAEGVVVLVLQRASRARAAGNPGYCLVAGSVVGGDGAAPAAVGAPHAGAQADLVRSAYTQTGIDPDAVGVVQAHGTGTRAGDRVEARALAKVFKRTRQDPLLVCSIKGAIGHLEGAAGLAGVAATALALHHGEVWPTAGHTRPDPVLAKHGLRVPTTVEPWARTGVRVAGVSAFGFGGTGAHAVLVQTPDPVPAGSGRQGAAEQASTAAPTAPHLRPSGEEPIAEEAAASEAAGPVVVPVSAQTPQVLAATAGDWPARCARALLCKPWPPPPPTAATTTPTAPPPSPPPATRPPTRWRPWPAPARTWEWSAPAPPCALGRGSSTSSAGTAPTTPPWPPEQPAP
ncbi:polyketide synthase [Streptomonospora sp. S1-112]|uniref:Polyketide synthase n=1 Tax=Streptomonospora mangrovi TaxID=2883123 RepID=A0A9X3NN63_9ACTN|nr:polyketide synthase [Streptomonospora mangrovi]MDA0565203.1 polyketide synthase [Streptomonospora mangrovi]